MSLNIFRYILHKACHKTIIPFIPFNSLAKYREIELVQMNMIHIIDFSRNLKYILSLKFLMIWEKQKKMGDFNEPGTHRSTNIKVKIETL